jgi:hypothetical protein
MGNTYCTTLSESSYSMNNTITPGLLYYTAKSTITSKWTAIDLEIKVCAFRHLEGRWVEDNRRLVNRITYTIRMYIGSI